MKNRAHKSGRVTNCVGRDTLLRAPVRRIHLQDHAASWPADFARRLFDDRRGSASTRQAIRLRAAVRAVTLLGVEPRREDLRRLADWLAHRRTVDEAVAHLTRYGPAANERVNHHLAALRQLLALEAEAFAVLERTAPDVPQLPLPVVSADGDDSVVSLTEGRRRRSRQSS